MNAIAERIFNIEHEEVHIQVWNYGRLKSWGRMQEVSRSHNIWQNQDEITPFTPKLWYYDIFWLTLSNILKLGGNARS